MKRFMIDLESVEVYVADLKTKIESLGFIRCPDDEDRSFSPSCIRTYGNGTYTLYRHKSWGYGDKSIINFQDFLMLTNQA